jgi:pimeloyl-ACP methyl ester carboxylesterase
MRSASSRSNIIRARTRASSRRRADQLAAVTRRARRRHVETPPGLELTLADGRTLAYAEYCDRRGWPLVYLHGFPGSRLAGGVLDEAARTAGVRVVAPERPGLGRSSPQPGRTLLDHASDVHALVEALGLRGFAVLGESGGGPYALALAYALPEQVECAAIVCGLGPVGCAGWADGIATKERIGYAIARRAPLLAGRTLVPIAAWAGRRPRAFLYVTRWQLGDADREVLLGPIGNLVAADFAEAFCQGGGGAAQDLALLFRPWPFDPGEIRIRVAFFHGTADRTVSLASTRGLAARVARAQLHVFEGHGHFSLLACKANDVFRVMRDPG